MMGAPGTVAGVALAVLDAVPVPTALTARRRTPYDVPLVSPVTTIGLTIEPAGTHAPAPSWYSYELMAEPLLLGGLKAMAIEPSPAVRLIEGALGTLGVVMLDAVDAAPVVLAVRARSLIAYVVPAARPVMVIGLEVVPADTQEP